MVDLASLNTEAYEAAMRVVDEGYEKVGAHLGVVVSGHPLFEEWNGVTCQASSGPFTIHYRPIVGESIYALKELPEVLPVADTP